MNEQINKITDTFYKPVTDPFVATGHDLVNLV